MMQGGFMYAAQKGEIVLYLPKPETGRYRPRYLGVIATCALSLALVACGGASDEQVTTGTLVSAKTTAVKSDDSKSVRTNDDSVKRATPLDPVITSKNRAMLKIAKKRCERFHSAIVDDNKPPHAVSSRRSSLYEACKPEVQNAG
jgi:hypothetical protein